MLTLKPALIALNDSGAAKLAAAIPSALSAEGWQMGHVDNSSQLATASKNNKYSVVFFWSDAQAKPANMQAATHLAVVVSSSEGSPSDSLVAQRALVQKIEAARDSGK